MPCCAATFRRTCLCGEGGRDKPHIRKFRIRGKLGGTGAAVIVLCEARGAGRGARGEAGGYEDSAPVLRGERIDKRPPGQATHERGGFMLATRRHV